MLWNQLKRKKLGCDFHRQKPVDNFIVDFFCSEHNLVIEINGKVHMDKGEYDLKRQCKLEALGLNVLRFKASDVLKNIKDVVEAIKYYIECEVSKNTPRLPTRREPPLLIEGNIIFFTKKISPLLYCRGYNEEQKR